MTKTELTKDQPSTPMPNRSELADIPDGADTPLNAATSMRDGSVLTMVERALDANDVLLAYQPIMQARAPHGVAFYEGLVRVLDITGRVIPATDFMAQAEDRELGRRLDCHALRLGLRALHQHPTLRLSINMSARSIGYRRWRQILARGLNANPTVGERLILEITEASCMTVPDIVAGFMEEMQKTGVAFALCDFGAGLSAVRYFKDLSFDAVKLDGEFCGDIHSTADNQVVTAALLSIARQFDMFTIASKVEGEEDARFLTSIGIDCLQGYLFGAPTTRPPWLKTHKQKRHAASFA